MWDGIQKILSAHNKKNCKNQIDDIVSKIPIDSSWEKHRSFIKSVTHIVIWLSNLIDDIDNIKASNSDQRLMYLLVWNFSNNPTFFKSWWNSSTKGW